jgi:hypothetical protein
MTYETNLRYEEKFNQLCAEHDTMHLQGNWTKEMEIREAKLLTKIMWIKSRMTEIDAMTCKYDGYEYITYQ